MNKYLEQAEEYARRYEKEAVEQEYHGPAILFGLMYEFLNPGDKVLDIAIGTGMDAVLFKKAGTRVFGIDGASEMLSICREKQVAEDLQKIDVLVDKFPYPDNYFNLALANALFHMIEDPSAVFQETSRVLSQQSVFGFTVDEMKPGKEDDYQSTNYEGVYYKKHPESGLNMYRHEHGFIEKLCNQSGFEILKRPDFLAFRGTTDNHGFYFTGYIVRKT